MAGNNQLQKAVLGKTNGMLTTMLENEAKALPVGFNSLRFKQNITLIRSHDSTILPTLSQKVLPPRFLIVTSWNTVVR